MIDRHYGHLARDGREHAIQLLDALNAPELDPWTPVDAAWMSSERAAGQALEHSCPRGVGCRLRRDEATAAMSFRVAAGLSS